MGKKLKRARQVGRDAGWREALLSLAENQGKFFDSLDSEIADALQIDKKYVAAHDAVVERDHRLDWADYFENWAGAVGPEAPTVEDVIGALRAKTVPFGVSAND